MNIIDNSNEHSNAEAFYASLKEKLDQNHQFPEEYLFKFIFPNDNEKLSEIYRIFDGLQYTINTRESVNGKYISTSIQAFVMDADQVINLYQEVQKIEGMVAL